MGRITTPTHRIKITYSAPSGRGHSESHGWSGRVSAKRLADYVQALADSLKLGGCNDHITKSLGYLSVPVKAEIIHQQSREVVQTWEAATFQVY